MVTSTTSMNAGWSIWELRWTNWPAGIGQLSFTLRTLRGLWPIGEPASRAEKSSSTKRASAARMENTAGCSTGKCHFAMRTATSSSGMDRVSTLRSGSGRKKNCDGASSIFQKGSVLPTWEAGFWTLRVVSLTGRMNFSIFMVLIRRKRGPGLRNTWQASIRRIRGSMRSLVNRMIAEASGCDVTKRIVSPSGEVRYVRCVGVPIVENGMLKRIVGSAIDVTGHEILTQELRRREAYLTEAQRLSHTGSFGWRPDT